MKIGVGINIFSGVEFLKPVLLSLRNNVDYIVGSYSTKSYTGNPVAPYVLPICHQLLKEGLLDKLVGFDSSIKTDIHTKGRLNYENSKKECVKAGCTHFMPYDCDEFYTSEGLQNIRKVAETNEIVICKLVEYINKPIYQIKVETPLHVCALHKIECPMQIAQYGVLLDTSRTALGKPFVIMDKSKVAMHHFTAVRFNIDEIKRKFDGHAHFIRLGEVAKNNYIKEMTTEDLNRCKIVEDPFGILKYWETEFKGFYEKYS